MSENCDDAIEQVYGYLDRELSESELDGLETHLKDCAPCLEMYDFEKHLKALISEKCRDKVPDEVRTRIQAALDSLASAESDQK